MFRYYKLDIEQVKFVSFKLVGEPMDIALKELADIRKRWGPRERGMSIKVLRDGLGLSARELGKLAGLSYQAILDIETARHEPRPETELKVLDALIEEGTRQRRAGMRIAPENVYGKEIAHAAGGMSLKDLHRHATGKTNPQPLHPLETEAIRTRLDVGRKQDSLTRSEALDFAERLIDLGKRLSEAGLLRHAHACVDESASLIEWARAKPIERIREIARENGKKGGRPPKKGKRDAS